MIGRAGSRGLPGKNTKMILGKSLCEFPLIACKKSKFVFLQIALLLKRRVRNMEWNLLRDQKN